MSLRALRPSIRAQLSQHGLADREDDATLVTTELVTNALRHTTATTVTLCLSSPADGALLIEVTDPDPISEELMIRSTAMAGTGDLPGRAFAGQSPSEAGPSGRGLDIVGVLGRWGVRAQGSGKIVWALLEQNFCEDTNHDPSDGHTHPDRPVGATGQSSARPADSRPSHLGAVHWRLASSARQARAAGGLPTLQRKELADLLRARHSETDTEQVLDRVSAVAHALYGAGDDGSLRLSATTGHLLVELTGTGSGPPVPDWLDTAYQAGADSAGRHRTFGEARSRQVHWATVALPVPRLTNSTASSADTASSPARALSPEPDDAWA